jgi:uncharacterized protein YqhQ
MMRGLTKTAMSVRLPDGAIDTESWEHKARKWYNKAPFIRGVINFCTSIYEGMRCIIKSAEKQNTDGGDAPAGDVAGRLSSGDKDGTASGDVPSSPPSKFELWLEAKFGEKIEKHFTAILIAICIVVCAFTILVFKFVPTFLSGLLNYVGAPDRLKTVVEGLIKFALICGYMFAVSKTEAMKTLFSYHGAEHKSIACFEAGLDLTIENVRPQTRYHPRCGTSFILFVIILSIIIGMFLPWTNIWVRYGLQLLMLLPEASLAYEIIKLAGRYDNPVTRVLSAPGMWLQHITTNEPSDEQIEVAIASIKAVV